MNTLPTKPGFYWWRASDIEEWQLVRVSDYGGLCAYSVDGGGLGGISLCNWTKLYPVGEWIEVKRP